MAFYRYDPTERPDPNNVGSKPGMADRELQEARRLAGIDSTLPSLPEPERVEVPTHFTPEEGAVQISEEMRRLSGLAPTEHMPARVHTGGHARELNESLTEASKPKKVTMATAKAAVKKHSKGVDPAHIEVTSDDVTVWLPEGVVGGSVYRAYEAAAKAIAGALGAGWGRYGNKWIIYYKKDRPDRGDWNDPSSRWHY